MPKAKSSCYTNRHIRRLRAKRTNYDLKLLELRNLSKKFSDSSSSNSSTADENDIVELSSESAREEFVDESLIESPSDNESDNCLSSGEVVNNNVEEQFNIETKNLTCENNVSDTDEIQIDDEQEIEKLLDFDFEDNSSEEIMSDSENENFSE